MFSWRDGIELSDLVVFRTVARAGGVTRASQQLHRVQSNVTTRVKKLEDELGIALFVREGRRMQLSAAGRTLLDYADRILTLAEEARTALHDASPRGVLRLGAMESTAAVRLPAPLHDFHRRYPDVTVELHTATPQQMVAQVLSGELDAALVAEPAVDNRLESRVVYDEELVLVTSSDHPPIGLPRDVTTRTLLAFHPGCPHRSRLEDWFARGGLVPDRVVEIGSYHAMLGCAVVGMGIALMPRSVIDAYSEKSRLGVHPLRGSFRSVRTLLVWRRDSPQPKIAALADTLAPRQPRRVHARKRGL
jgi:DNA-binding transcriptional LysR family regulator